MKHKIQPNKSIEELEDDYWQDPVNFPTILVQNIYSIRRKKIRDLDLNEIRILISQNIGLDYLIPIAIERLESNLLEEAFFYPGDFLLTVLTVSDEYWLKNINEKKKLISLLNNKAQSNLRKTNEINEEIKEDLENAINKFIK